MTRRPAPQGQRFPGAYRLKHRRLLRPLFRRGEAGTVAAGCLRLLFRRVPRDTGQPAVQVAFLPGRQPDAVTRNRVRRILREVLRRHLARLVDLLPLAPAEMLTLGILLRGAPGPDLYARVSEDLPRALDRMLEALGASGGLADAPSLHNPGPDAA